MLNFHLKFKEKMVCLLLIQFFQNKIKINKKLIKSRNNGHKVFYRGNFMVIKI